MEEIIINDLKPLTSGENLHQSGYISPVENGLEYKILTENKDLEYADYLNLAEVSGILAEFFDVNTTAISKDGKLCSVALGSSIENSFEKAIDCNPACVVYSTIGFSKEVDLPTLKTAISMKIKNLIAPSFDKAAIEYLSKPKGINVIKINSPLQEVLGFDAKDIKVTPFGYLIQEQNFSKLTKSAFKVAGKIKPSQQQAEDAIFAWKVVKHCKSTAMVVAKDLSTKAIVQGNLNATNAAENALDFACENSKDAVLAIDTCIDTEQVINTAIQGRIGLIIESGDNIKSAELSKICDKYNISLIQTGIRNNRY